MMSLGEGTILVVEDELGLRALTEEVLSEAGFRVFVAQDAAEALRVSQEYPGQIRLLLTDLSLPGTPGKDIAALLKAVQPEMKVLFMSGHPREIATGNGALDSHANFIQKPWTPSALRDAISATLDAQPPAQRVLVVDDEDGMRDWLAEILEGSGHHVFTAKDGVEAKKLAQRQPVDLMITDISMPNEEGLGIICAFRKAHPEVKIIAMSGANPEALVDAKLLGAKAALAKPFTSETVLKCIREISQMPAKAVSHG
jgi:DNA-binding NtrC family response regulator